MVVYYGAKFLQDYNELKNEKNVSEKMCGCMQCVFVCICYERDQKKERKRKSDREKGRESTVRLPEVVKNIDNKKT